MLTVECSMTWTVRSFGGDFPCQTIRWPRWRSRVSVTPSYSPTLTSLPPEIDVFPLENLFISIDYIFFSYWFYRQDGDLLFLFVVLFFYFIIIIYIYLGDAYFEIASGECRPFFRCRKNERDPEIILNK